MNGIYHLIEIHIQVMPYDDNRKCFKIIYVKDEIK